jgi:hypothetical protein
MGGEKEGTELIADVIFVVILVAIILLIVFAGAKGYANNLGNLPRSFLGYILDKLGQRWWG